MKLILKTTSSSSLTTLIAIILLMVSCCTTSTSALSECATGCTNDDDCDAALLCSNNYIDQLRGLGYDVHKVNCNIRSRFENGFENEIGSNNNDDPYICFNPNVVFSELPPPTNGGGAMGDPHFQMFDGTKYSYHGQCDLIMVHSPAFYNGAGLTIHARTDIIDNSWSLISAIAIQFGTNTNTDSSSSTVLEFQNDGTIYYNGNTTELQNDMPFIFPFRNNEFSITKKETEITAGIDDENVKSIELPEHDIQTHYRITVGKYRNDIIIGNYRRMMSIRIDTILYDTIGMLGYQPQPNGNNNNDDTKKKGMTSRDGLRTLMDPNEMGQEWQVTNSDPQLFINKEHVPQYPEKCILPSNPIKQLEQERRMLRGYSQHEIDRANKACASVDDGMKQFCIDDVLQTGDVTMAHGYGTGF